MSESEIEGRVCQYARDRGFLVYKFYALYQKGVPDRLLVRKGRVFFIEFKKKGKFLREIQKYQCAQLASHNIPVYVVDGLEQGIGLINNMLMNPRKKYAKGFSFINSKGNIDNGNI